MNNNELAKIIILAGIVLIAVGVIILAFGKAPGLGKLPGDLYIKREGFTFYFPITTCLVISIILSIIYFLIKHR